MCCNWLRATDAPIMTQRCESLLSVWLGPQAQQILDFWSFGYSICQGLGLSSLTDSSGSLKTDSREPIQSRFFHSMACSMVVVIVEVKVSTPLTYKDRVALSLPLVVCGCKIYIFPCSWVS